VPAAPAKRRLRGDCGESRHRRRSALGLVGNGWGSAPLDRRQMGRHTPRYMSLREDRRHGTDKRTSQCDASG
jgi:hypothetical protein